MLKIWMTDCLQLKIHDTKFITGLRWYSASDMLLHLIIIINYALRTCVGTSRGINKCLVGIFRQECIECVVNWLLSGSCGFLGVQPTHSSLGDREDIFVTRLIVIITSDAYKFPIVVNLFRCCVSGVIHFDPTQAAFWFHHCWVCLKALNT